MQFLESDWLNCDPVFYNERTGAASRRIHEVVDWANLEFDPEGFNLYLEAGYSVFGKTPIRNVRFLPPCCQLMRFDDGTWQTRQMEDPCRGWVGHTSKEGEAWARIAEWIHDWELQSDHPIVIPLSGGLDSRLLSFFVRDRHRVRTFTYGLAADQSSCREVVLAREVARRLGLEWQRIPLGTQHDYLSDWFSIFGPSTHAHGMYHIEFYRKIRHSIGPPRQRLLSGILGDVFAGSWTIEPIERPEQLSQLFRHHGLCADPRQSRLAATASCKEKFFEEHREVLKDPVGRVVWAARTKAILLSYLIRVPTELGFDPGSPFLDADVVRSMVTLAPQRRQGRRWQLEFIEKNSLDVESIAPPAAVDNSLNLSAMEIRPLKPLDEGRLEGLVNPDYVRWINRHVRPRGRHPWRKRWIDRPMGAVARRLRRMPCPPPELTAYAAYLTLWPIQMCLECRQEAQRRESMVEGSPR